MKQRLNKLRKVLSGVLVSALSMTLFAGCGGETSQQEGGAQTSGNTAVSSVAGGGSTAAPDASSLEPVELTMYLVGDKPEGIDDVYARINEILKEKINATIKVEWLSWAEHQTKYSLLFSGTEDFDMIFTASGWCHFEQTAALGGFATLTEDMLKTYAPDVWNALPAQAWKQATIDGKIQMIPANFVEVNQDVVAIRGDLIKKYGYDDINSFPKLMEFFEKCSADGMYGTMGGESLYWMMFESNGYYSVNGAPTNNPLIFYHYTDPTDTKIVYAYDWQPFTDYCREAKKLASSNCWPSDVMNATYDRQDGLLSGHGSAMVWNVGSCQTFANQANAEHPEWDVNIYNVMPDVTYRASSYVNNGMGFNAASKHLDRALMAYNLLATNQEIHDLTQLGIEGTNWIADGDKGYKLTDTPYDASNFWGWRNMDIMRTQSYDNPTAVDKRREELETYFLAHVSEDHPLSSFMFNQEPVATQCAAVGAIEGTYLTPLLNGLVDDVDASLAEFKAALESAGIQDILSEMNSQLDAYLAAL